MRLIPRLLAFLQASSLTGLAIALAGFVLSPAYAQENGPIDILSETEETEIIIEDSDPVDRQNSSSPDVALEPETTAEDDIIDDTGRDDTGSDDTGRATKETAASTPNVFGEASVDEIRKASRIFAILISAMNDDRVKSEIKNKLFECSFNNDVRAISSAANGFLDANPKLSLEVNSHAFLAISGVCGVDPKLLVPLASPQSDPQSGSPSQAETPPGSSPNPAPLPGLRPEPDTNQEIGR